MLSDPMSRQEPMEDSNILSLKYPLPHAPKSPSPLIDPAPWHCGGEVLHVTFRADKNNMRLLIPPPLEMGPNPGEGAVWFTEWVSVSESKPDLAFTHPERAVYRECIVMVGCQYKGRGGLFAPCAWIDNDLTYGRGLIQGFPKKTGRVSLTRLHPLNPRIGGKRIGAKVRGVCLVNAEKVAEGSMVFTRPSEPSELPGIKLFLLHRFPTIEDPTRAAVHELTAGRVADVRIADVWAGDGDLRFFDSILEDLPDLGQIETTGAFYFSMGMSILGGEVIYKYV